MTRSPALALLALVLATAAVASPARACETGAEACPAVARMAKGAISVLVSGELTEKRPSYSITFEARAGQKLTIEPVQDPGVKWGAGVPITFPGGKDGDAVDRGRPFTLPRDGAYVIRLIANTMADNVYGPFVIRLAIR